MLNKFQHIDIMVCYSLSLSFQCDVIMFHCFLWNSFIDNCCFYLSYIFFFLLKEIDIGLAADLGTLQKFPKIIGNDRWTLFCYFLFNTIKPQKSKWSLKRFFLIPLILKIRKKKAAGLVELQSYPIVSILIFSLARELCFTGRRFTAEEALQFGFVRFVLWYLLQTELKV